MRHRQLPLSECPWPTTARRDRLGQRRRKELSATGRLRPSSLLHRRFGIVTITAGGVEARPVNARMQAKVAEAGAPGAVSLDD